MQCGEKLKLFKETKVIPGLCHACYKMQILPENREAMFQAYVLLLNLDLPGDNARKCRIELRDGIEGKHFASRQPPPPQTHSNTKPLISLRDVFAFRTRIKYAELIGDQTSRKYQAAHGPDLPPPIVKRVKGQAALRHREMQELAALS